MNQPLNPKYTFDAFMVRDSNKRAFREAIAAARSFRVPSRLNPLLIVGPQGSGKTHLLHAIGNELSQQYSKPKICCTSFALIEEKICELEASATMLETIGQVSDCKVLLIDDLQYFAKAVELQLFLFDLIKKNKHEGGRIICASRHPLPRIETLGLLVDLFEKGTVVKIRSSLKQFRKNHQENETIPLFDSSSTL